MIYWTKKIKLKKIVFKKFQRILLKMIFELMIWIYLFTKKKESIYFLNFICIQFSKNLFTLIVWKEFITKFQFGHKNYFYLLLLENNEFLQFYL